MRFRVGDSPTESVEQAISWAQARAKSGGQNIDIIKKSGAVFATVLPNGDLDLHFDGAEMFEFKPGESVRLSTTAIAMGACRGIPRDGVGVVLRVLQTRVQVLWDDERYPPLLHPTLLERVPTDGEVMGEAARDAPDP